MLAPLLLAASFLAQPQPNTPHIQPVDPAPESKPESVVDQLKAEAAKLAPLVKSDLARAFLDQVGKLPEPRPTRIYRSRDRSQALTPEQWKALPTEKQLEFKLFDRPPVFFYYTGYGSPLVYSRVVDLTEKFGLQSLDRKKVLDFGYGTIGHLRLMAELGAEAHGVDVEPMFAPLYSAPGDTGFVHKFEGQGGSRETGSVHIHTGQWPANAELTKAVGNGYDVITSKNTLKEGYIHPKPPAGKKVNDAQLVHLGVDDATFLTSVHDSLKPGGLFIIYNISPAQSPADDPQKDYLPHADGKSPFTKDQFAAANLEVLAFDVEDNDWVLDCWAALGYDNKKPRAETAKDIFSWYTVAKRKD